MSKEILELIKTFSTPELKIDILDTMLHNMMQFHKQNKIFQFGFSRKKDTMNFIPLNNKNLDDAHLVEILNKSELNNINLIPELMQFIIDLNVNNYCIVCHEKLDFQSNIYIACSNSKCLYKYEELVVGDPVTEKIKQDDQICMFLIESAIDAINCGREYDIFEPFPSYFLKSDLIDLKRGEVSKLSGKNYDAFKDFDRIKNALKKLNMETFLNLVQECNSDTKLADKLGQDLYILIRFILMSCKLDIQKNDDVLDIKSDKFIIYKIIHSQDKEEEFKKLAGNASSAYLFHGSRWANWFSILRNGLKNCSSSKLMTAGAAYGNGIYLSGDINVSYGFGVSGHKSIVGVFEIINKDKYSKSGHQIYVVDDEKVLIQRYLLIIPSKNANCLNDINAIFNKKIYEEKITVTAKYNKKSIAKIIREYKQLTNMNKDNALFRIDVNPDYPFVWHIFLDKFDDKYPIAQDMKKFGIKEIELEVRFPDSYPFSSPFIRVVSPRFMHLTGHITSAGALCLEILTEKGWMPTCSIESLITIIMSEIIEGGGRLDPQKYHIPYSYEESKASFVNVAKSHGWM
jgi:ubiquitin-protein ligase